MRGKPASALAFRILAGYLLCSFIACGTESLNLRQDRRLEILRPEHRGDEKLPVEVAWQVREPLPPEFDSFGVFFDRSPQPPGEPLTYLARRDRLCKRRPSCPDRAWFTGNGVYRTKGLHFEAASLRDTRPPGRPERAEAHVVTIVFLDKETNRIGESAFSREFFLVRP